MLSGVVASVLLVAFFSFRTAFDYGAGADANMFMEYIGECVSGKASHVLLISYILVALGAVLFFAIRGKNLFSYTALNYASLFSVVAAIAAGISFNMITNELFFEGSGVAGEISFVAVLCLVFGAVMEEFMFRGVLIKMFGSACGITGAVLITSLLFSLSHGDIYQIIYTFFLGVILAVIRVCSTSLWPPIMLHLSYNLAGLLWSGMELGETELWVTVAVCAVSVFISASGGRKVVEK